MLFSDLEKILQQWMPRILNHPFNQGLADGSLSRSLFNAFIEKDKIYLISYANALTTIANRLKQNHPFHADKFHEFSKFVRETELDSYREYSTSSHPRLFKTAPLTQSEAMEAYIHYLHETTTRQSISIAIAAVLPCVVIFRELGRCIPITPEHRFYRWIETYSEAQFLKMTEWMTDIFNEHSQVVQHDHIETSFITSIQHEINFLDSVCNKKHTLPTPTHKP
jgi:thiaminase/transcriptional activator TenA